MTIGALARATGLRPSAIRYYERLGLIPAAPRRSGWRDYGADDVQRLKRVVAARALGFSMRQLMVLGRTLADRRALDAALTAKVVDLDARIESLHRTRATVAALLACRCNDARACERIA